MNCSSDLDTIIESKYLRLVQRQAWEFVQRIPSSQIVVIVPVTDDEKLIFVEQYRPPLDCPVVEFPAGIAGDLPEHRDEDLEQAARRELVEETGYEAGRIQRLFTAASSAGITDEMVTFFLADGLRRVGPGGGDASEKITVHQIPLADTEAWLRRVTAEGKQMDAKIYAGLYFAQQSI